ncbi:DMSO/TMAO reductase YedYZ, molybdopterin-dependent catalytic subunit [Variovorax sp. CF079]|nr:DMSO/TMAO reductase YedYZ, molybdopterin-dependent catalytic subunit [Variovorax sp. CF079]
MDAKDMARRQLMRQGGAALAGLALLHSHLLAQAFPARPGEEVIPWLDQPPSNPSGGVVENLPQWEELSSFLTPTDKFFRVAHYNKPVIDEKAWALEITGLVKQPKTLTLPALKARPRKEVVFTLECSGNHGFPWFISGIGTARWAGTPLAPLLKEAGVLNRGMEVVFVGSDAGEEEVRQAKMPQHFARSMSLVDAMNPNNLLCYEMNGAALPQPHGFPVRLIAPGWYGIANVKWLKRIEIWDTRFMGRFMARDYVTIREEQRNQETVWTETSVGRALLKSVPAKVTGRNGKYRIVGAAWGPSVARVEVQIDAGPWVAATMDRSEQADFAWKLWSLEWANATPGEHAITSRAVDTQGNVQPAMEDPRIAKKRTYWESNGQVTRRVRLT